MKAGIKMQTFSHVVVNHQIFFLLGQVTFCMHACVEQLCLILLQLKRCTLCARKWIAFCSWQSLNYTPMFNKSLVKCSRTKQHQYTDL